MTVLSQIRRLSILAGVGTMVLVVAACAIQLREKEQSSSASSTAEDADPLAAELERCRTVTSEQKDALAACRRIWAEQRRQFLRQNSTPAPTGNDNAPNIQAPTPRKNESRAPQAWPSVPTWQGE